MFICFLLLQCFASVVATCTQTITPAPNGTDVWQFLTTQNVTATAYNLCLANATTTSPFTMGSPTTVSFPSADLVIDEGQNVTVIDGHIVNVTDTGVPYYSRSQCNFYQGSLSNNLAVFFTVSSGGALTFHNVVIDNIRVRAKSFIIVSGGTYVGFINTSIMRMDFAQPFLADSSGGATQATVEFNGAYITGFNRDHPYSLASQLDFGLLSLKSGYLLYIRNSVIEYNFMLDNNLFIYANISHFEITASQFRSCMGGINLNLYSSSTTPNTIRNTVFDSNFGSKKTILELYILVAQSLVLDNCSFVNNLDQRGGILGVNNPDQILGSVGLVSSTPFVNVTIVNSNFTNNRIVFPSSDGVIALNSVPCLVIKHCTIYDNLLFDPSFPYNVFRYMLDHGLINDSPDLQASVFSVEVGSFPCQFCASTLSYLTVSQLHVFTSAFASQYGVLVLLATYVSVMSVSDSSFSSYNATELWVQGYNPISNESVLVIRNCDFLGPSQGGIELRYAMDSRGGIAVYESRFLNMGTTNSQSSGISVIGLFMTISNCLFDSNQGIIGSAIYFKYLEQYTEVSGESERTVSIADSQFRNEFARSSGSCLYMESTLSSHPLALYIGNCSFVNSTSQGLGGPIYLYIITFSSVLIEHCAFTSGSTSRGGMIDLSYITGAIAIRNSSFTNIVTSGNIINLRHFRSDPKHGTSVRLSNNVFRDCAFTAGINIALQTSLLVDSVSNTYSSNYGTVVWSEQGTFRDSGSLFANNSFEFNPCFYQSGKSAVAEFNGTTFVRNRATDTVGAVMISTGSTASFRNCRFEGNSAGDLAGAMQVEMGSKVTISGCEFLGNWAISAASLYLLEIDSTVPLSISDSVFIGNAGEGLLQMTYSSLNMQNVTIQETQSENIAGIMMIQSNLSIAGSHITHINGHLGCVLYGVMGSNVIITESALSNIICQQESVLLLSNLNSTLRITGSSLVRMTATTAIVISIGTSGLLLLDTVRIEEIDSLSAVFSLRGMSAIVTHCVFTSASSVVLLADQSRLQIINSSFHDLDALTTAGAVDCTNCIDLSLIETTLTNVSAVVAAGVYVVGSNNTVLVERCRFEGLRAERSGALAVVGGTLTITGSFFTGNVATGAVSYGGAVFINTSSSVLTTNIFSGNAATNGGAIYWMLSQPTGTSNTYEGNTAVYGNNTASYAFGMHLVNDSVPIGVSGQVFTREICVELLDHYGQVVNTDNSSVAWMSSNSTLTGNLKGTASQGVLTFSQFTVTALPNSTLTIFVTTESLSLTFPLYLRACVRGEVLSGQACELCPSGRYSLEANSISCSMCLENADCPGNSTLYPRTGFWRPDQWYNGLFQCPLVSACLGNADYSNSTGVCAEGYTGNMCQSCASNYTREGKDLCTACQSEGGYFLERSFIAFGIATFLVIVVKSLLTSVEDEENSSGLLLRIFLNHLHYTVLVAHFGMLWPDNFEEMLDVYEYLGNSGEQFIIGDCSEGQVYFKEIVIISVLPAALILVCLIFWALIRCVFWKPKMIQTLICSLTIIFLFVHPLLVRVAFSVFRCITIKPGQHWLRFEMSVSCWESNHLYYSLAAALPALILWGFGLPLIVLLIIIKKRRQGSLSFMCVGYKSSLYYWEFVKIYWKVFIIVLYVFMSYEQISLQALTLCVSLWISAALQSKCQPFRNPSMNRLELHSIWVSIISAYSGIWYSLQALSYHAETVLFGLIALAHIHFLVLWALFLLQTLWAASSRTHPRCAKLCPRLQRMLRVHLISRKPPEGNQTAEIRTSNLILT